MSARKSTKKVKPEGKGVVQTPGGGQVGPEVVAGVKVPEEGLPAFVGTWDELAGRLGVTRKAIQNWRDDPRIAPEIEARRAKLERADGRHCVAEWMRLMKDLRLNRGRLSAEAEELEDEGGDDDQGADVLQPPRIGGKESDWAKANKAKEYEKRAIEVDTIRGTLLEAADLEVPIGATFAAIQGKLSQFAPRVARYLVGLRDVAEVEERLRDEIDADLGEINAAHFTAADAVAAAVAAVPFDEETAALCEKLLFAGADREALLQLAGAIATAALRGIGRRVLQKALNQVSVPDTAIADEKTGQVTSEAEAREDAGRNGGAAQSAPTPLESGPPDPSAKPSTDTPSADRSDPAAQKRSPARKARRNPIAGPAESEAMIAPSKQRKATRRRRK